ncbi:MAG: cation transporting ATPase C-terminal domain-containing protein, partial [Anaerolineae bacterium]
LIMAELARAYTSRSERYSVRAIGPFTNLWMLGATVSSFVLLIAVLYIPFLQPVFNTTPLHLEAWGVVAFLMLMPAIGAELAKFWMRGRPPGGGEGKEFVVSHAGS